MRDVNLTDVLLEAIRYEHWLRFYFMDAPDHDTETGASELDLPPEDLPEAVFRVPPAWVETSRQGEPHLYPLLQILQGQAVTMDSARDSVFCYVGGITGMAPEDPAFGEQIFQLIADPDFRRGLDAFHGWVQELANGAVSVRAVDSPDKDAPVAFGLWQAGFRQWESKDAVRHITTISPYTKDGAC